MNQNVTLQLPVSAAMYHAMHERARQLGHGRAANYAGLLLNAAFNARIGHERGEPSSDRELDEQVKLVFAHAGQGRAEAIGRAIGVPAARVERILEGLKLHFASRAASPPAAAGAPAAQAKPARAKGGGGPVELTDAQSLIFTEIASRCAAGVTTASYAHLREICATTDQTIAQTVKACREGGLLTVRKLGNTNNYALTAAGRAMLAELAGDD